MQIVLRQSKSDHQTYNFAYSSVYELRFKKKLNQVSLNVVENVQEGVECRWTFVGQPKCVCVCVCVYDYLFISVEMDYIY
jgi:hypothetical protein